MYSVCCRLKAETQAVSDLQAELLAVRRQNVELEKQLGRQGLEKPGVLTSCLEYNPVYCSTMQNVQ